MGVLVAAGLIPLATNDNDGLMPKGLRSYNKYIENSKIIEIIKLNYTTSKSLDCFIGISKNHEDLFILCGLHVYIGPSGAKNAFIKVLVEKSLKSYNFYMLKEDKSISIFLQTDNRYSDVFVTPIFACTFDTPEFNELDALPEGAELIEIVQ